MQNILLIFIGKLIITLSQKLNLGGGSTWPGHVALSDNKHFIRDILKKSETKIIIVAGTNGKTTTGKLIHTILEQNGKKVFRNTAGANLLNGVASTLIAHVSIDGSLPYDYAVLEIDENTLPHLLKEITPTAVIILNIFRDQLDRYGETDSIATKWQFALQKLTKETSLFLNADDPQIAFLGREATATVSYFGLSDKKLHQKTYQHASDSTFCPNCATKLHYETVYFSHLGDWLCPKCGYQKPKTQQKDAIYYPLAGVYNRYNTMAAILIARWAGVDGKTIEEALKSFTPAFGRQEVVTVNNKKIMFFLSKNPTSFNQSLKTIIELKAKHILMVLNDRIPDGRDVSWIWDVDLEPLKDVSLITITGDRAYDLGIRVKYENIPKDSYRIYESLPLAIKKSFEFLSKNETLYILPTYSAMLDVRKILMGKKLL